MAQDATTVEAAVDVGRYVTPRSRGTSHPTVYLWVTATGNYDFPKVTRAIRAKTAGVLQYKDANDATVLAEFLAGETRHLIARSVVGAGTTITSLEGMP